MAQDDYNIPNQSFPAFRSDLNSALSAINSSNSGTSRPSSAVTGTIWLDTTNGVTDYILKFFDGSEDITLANINTTANTVNFIDSSVASDVLNDTSPQLGGNLDTNSNNILIDDAHFIGDENGLEQIIFQTTASAVNELEVTNAATGNPPILGASGETNVDLHIKPKGSGETIIGTGSASATLTTSGTHDLVLDTNKGTNSGNITITDGANGAITATPNGTGEVVVGGNTNPGTLVLNCESNSHGIKLQSPAHSSGQSYTLKFPTGNVTADRFLKVDSVSGSGVTGVGQLSFAEAGGGGGWVKISTVTASSSATVDFDNVASTYKMYAVVGTLVTPATSNILFQMNLGTDGSSYALNKTSIYYTAYNNTGDSDGALEKVQGYSLGNATANQTLGAGISNTGATAKGNTMVALFGGLAQGGYVSYNIDFNYFGHNNYIQQNKIAGQVMAEADCIRFLFSSGAIASGTFTLFGIDQS